MGLGKMGRPMVNNLAKKKFNIGVYDINRKSYGGLTKKNINKIYSLKDIPKKVDIYISMLPDGKALSKLVLGSNGILNSLTKGAIWIDCSSIDYDTTVKLYKVLKKHKISFLDAPVSGGVTGAVNSTLTIMVGGDNKVFKKSYKCLSSMGKNIIYIGKSGSGQIVKACNNLMLGINMIGISEAFSLAKKFDIDEKVFYDICSNSSGSSWAMLNHLPIKGIVKNTAANNNFKPGYSAGLIKKDLNISQSMAKKVKIKTSLGAKAKILYEHFCSKYDANLDYSAIIKLFK